MNPGFPKILVVFEATKGYEAFISKELLLFLKDEW
jgi:hypothetical protein